MLDADDDDLPRVPVPDSGPVPVPGARVDPDATAAGGSVQDRVLSSVDREQSEELLKLARASGVKEDDPL